MLSLALALSIAVAPGDFLSFGKEDQCKEQQEAQRKYYITNVVGLLMVVGGLAMISNDERLGGGFAVGIGLPFATLGGLGMLEIYKW